MSVASKSPPDSAIAAGGPRRLRGLIAGLLALALALRLWLVWGGGQNFWPDESRYIAARDAVVEMSGGHLRSGLTSLVAQGDHVGFKLLSLVPAELQRLTKVDDLRLPAAFFALFSWAGLGWLWLWTRRTGASPEAQAWTLLLAVTCTSLTFYVRHLFPYDTSLALALAALAVGAKPRASLPRAAAAGALAGAAVLVYFGYWLLGGVALAFVAAAHRETWGRRVARAAATALGFAAVLGAVWLLDQWGAGTMIANSRKFSGTIVQGDFGQGYRLVAAYFWAAEGPAFLLWVAAAAYATRRVWRDLRGPRALAPAWYLSVAGLAMILGGLLLMSDVVHKFVVYGRLARQLVPFCCVAGGLALAEWRSGVRRARLCAGLAIAGLALNGAWHLAPALTQMFPDEFRRLGKARLASAPAIEPGQTYYRFVNVDHYLFEPEVLPVPPEATLLARRHPYEFAPYLYEGITAQQRAVRRATDQRMRLVLMRVPPAQRVVGDTYGQVTLKVRFASGRAGMSEPLLSLGPRKNGDLFFVRYESPTVCYFGMESEGVTVVTGPPVTYEAGRDYEVECFNGGMLPPADHDNVTAAQRLYYQNLASIRLDGVTALNTLVTAHHVSPAEVYAGLNFVEASSADTAFSGVIAEVRRGGFPPLPAGGLGDADYGAVRMVAWLPAAAAGVPEPLVVVGVTGKATLGYVRVLPGGQAKFGAEFWGVGAFESDAVAAPSDAPTEVVFNFPALFPPVGAARWGGVPVATQQALRTHLTILVNGRKVFEREVPDTGAPNTPVEFGANPAGGSWVTDRFSGRLVQGMRLPLAQP